MELELGAHRLQARLTPAAARDLALRPGIPVIALLKTAAIHPLDAEATPAP